MILTGGALMTGRPYGIICPISLACEILEPRWTIQILCEIWGGSSRFNDIRRGVGNISPALLSRRLKEMETLGLVDRVEDRATGAIDYLRTARAIELEPALLDLSRWAQRNIDAEIAVRSPNVSTMMWAARRNLRIEELPARRVAMRFSFTDAPTGQPHYWIVAQRGAPVDLCVSNPGLDIDLFVETRMASMAALILGRTTAVREIEKGRLFLSGDARLIRSIEHWFPREDDYDIEGVLHMQDQVAP